MTVLRTVTVIFLAIGAGAPALGQPAPAAPAAPGHTPVPRTAFIETMDAEFRRMDADHNGILTKKEIEDFQRAISAIAVDRERQMAFAALDADHNGVITLQEFAKVPIKAPPPNAAPVLAQTDLNRDGSVTLVEYRSGKLLNFDRMDTDKDGVVSVAEMRAAGLIK